jgi:hypothetical protein
MMTLDGTNGATFPDTSVQAGSAYYKPSNIKGTVSQVAGVPTGAVVEHGSNANGEYVRWADGTQICNFAFSGSIVISGYTAGLYIGTVPWIFPIAFSVPPVVTGGGVDSSVNGWIGGAAPSATSGSVAYYSGSATNTATLIRLVAIGRWY